MYTFQILDGQNCYLILCRNYKLREKGPINQMIVILIYFEFERFFLAKVHLKINVRSEVNKRSKKVNASFF